MDDIAAKLSELLGDPESLNKLKGLSGLLGKEFGNESPSHDEKPKPKNDFDDIPIDTVNTIMKMMPLISSMNKDDENTRFLLALKPLLGEERKKKIDQSIRMLQMMRIMPLLKNKELFSQ